MLFNSKYCKTFIVYNHFKVAEILETFQEEIKSDIYISHFYQTCVSIHDYQHPDLPALLICLEYLQHREGSIWRMVQDRALLNDYTFYLKVSEGLLYLRFFTALDVVLKYKQTKCIMKTHIDLGPWDERLVELAKLATIFSYSNDMKTISNTIGVLMNCYYKNLPRDYYYQLIRIDTFLPLDSADIFFCSHAY